VRGFSKDFICQGLAYEVMEWKQKSVFCNTFRKWTSNEKTKIISQVLVMT